MPRRRSAGGALGAGIGAGLSSLGDTLTELAMKRWENDMLLKRQQDLSASNRMQTLQDAAAKDPALARRLAQAGVGKAQGIDFSQFAPTPEDLMGAESKSVGAAHNPSELNTPEGMISNIRSQGGIVSDTPVEGQTQVKPTQIAQLLAARKARDTQFRDIENRTPFTKKEIGPDATEYTSVVPIGDVMAGGPFPSERSSSQEARRQGGVAGAQASAQAQYGTSISPGVDAEGKPAFFKIDKHTNRATPIQGGEPVLPAGASGAGGMTPSIRAGLSRLKVSLGILQTLDSALTQQPGWEGKWEGIKQQFQANLTGADTPASLYQGVSDSLLPALARSSGEVGNLAEQEQVRYGKLAPKVTDPLNIRRGKYAAIQYIIDSAAAGKTATEMVPFLNYLQFVPKGDQRKTARQLLEEARKRGAVQ